MGTFQAKTMVHLSSLSSERCIHSACLIEYAFPWMCVGSVDQSENCENDTPVCCLAVASHQNKVNLCFTPLVAHDWRAWIFFFFLAVVFFFLNLISRCRKPIYGLRVCFLGLEMCRIAKWLIYVRFSFRYFRKRCQCCPQMMGWKWKRKRESLINSCSLLGFHNSRSFSGCCCLVKWSGRSGRGQEMAGVLARLSRKAEFWVMAWKPQLSLSCKDKPWVLKIKTCFLL